MYNNSVKDKVKFLQSHAANVATKAYWFICSGMRMNLSKKKENGQIPSKQAENEWNCQIWETKIHACLFKF